MVTFFFGGLLRLGSNIILARLLFPEAFAIAGIVVTVFFILELSSDLGFHAYVIRHDHGDDKTLLDTLWTIRFLRGFVLAAIMMSSSWLLGDFFGSEKLQPVFFVSAFVFVINGVEPFSFFVSERNNNVAKVLYLQFVALLISTIFIISISYFWRSYWPLIIGLFLGKIILMVFGYVFFENSARAFRMDMVEAKDFWKFSKIIIPTSLITIVLMQGEKTIVVRVLDLSEAGVYFVAVAFSAAAYEVVTSYPRRVLYPVFAKIVREKISELQSSFYKRKTVITLLFSFGCGLGIGGANLFFDLVYDERYANAGTYLSILLFNPLLATVSYPAEICLVALGQIRRVLIANILRLIWILVAVYLGYTYYGVIGLIAAFSLMEIFPIIYYWRHLSRADVLMLHKELYPLIMACFGFMISWSIDFYLS